MNCKLCGKKLVLSKPRENHYASANCKVCKLQHSYWMGVNDTDPQLSLVISRLEHNGDIWQAIYLPDQDKTFFKKIEMLNLKPGETLLERLNKILKSQEYKMESFVTMERFLSLLVFL